MPKKPSSRISGRLWPERLSRREVLKTSILAVAATAIGIAVLSIGNPVALVANVTDSLVDKSALQPGADPSTSTTQSIAGTQDLPPTTTHAPTRDEVAAAVEPADQSQAETGQPLTEALFKQFQAWAAEDDTRAKAEPAQPAQAAPVRRCAGCPGTGPACEKAPTGAVRAKCASRDPAPSKSSSKGPGRAKCAGTDRARIRRPSAGAGCANFADAVVPAEFRFAVTQLHRNCASLPPM